MSQLEIDGVVVLWADVPGPLTATLTFGVGARDESFHSIGVTHMVEHFAPPSLARVINKSACGHRIVPTRTGVAHVDGDGGGVHVVDFDQVAAVQTGERQRVVFGLNGCVAPVDLDLFPSAKSMFAPIDAAVPAHLHFALTERLLAGTGRG